MYSYVSLKIWLDISPLFTYSLNLNSYIRPIDRTLSGGIIQDRVKQVTMAMKA